MGYFSGDSAGTIDGSVQPVYVSLGDAGSLAAIYPLTSSGTVSCKFIGSPSERGETIFDNKIFMPMKFTIHGLVKPENFALFMRINNELYQRKIIKGKAYTKCGYFPDMMVESMEMITNTERYDAMEIKLTLVEYMEADQKVKD